MVKHELRVTSYELGVESSKVRVAIQKYEFKSASYELQFTSYKFRSAIMKSIKTQVNSLKISLFPKILSPKLLGNSFQFNSGDDLLFYVSTTPRLRLQQEAEWVNINSERRNINSPQKSHPRLNILGEIFNKN